MKKINLILLVLPFILFSCDSTDDLLSTGQFDSTFTGSITKEFNGEAAFVHVLVVSSTPKGSSLAIGLSTVANQDENITLTVGESDNTDGIVAGTYILDSNATSGPLFLPSYVNGQEIWFPNESLTNKIIISSVGNNLVKGSFEINMIKGTSQLDEITIKGTFNAVGTTTTQ